MPVVCVTHYKTSREATTLILNQSVVEKLLPVDSEKSDRERLSRVILNLGMLSEVICNRFTEDAYLPRVVCTVFGFAR